MMRFEGRTVLITGAGSGIGRAAAVLFAGEGAIVAVNDLRPEAAQETADQIAAAGGRALCLPGDIARREDIEQVVTAVLSDCGRIDILLNHVGMSYPDLAENHSKFGLAMDVNVIGMFNCAQLCAVQSMIPQGGGVIVNTTSIAGLGTTDTDVSYVASKHAVVGLTKALAAEWAKYNIRVNAVAPGLTKKSPDMAYFQKARPEAYEEMTRRIPLGRMADAVEQARVMAFLASDDASYVTGHTLVADGGLHTKI